AIFNCDHCRCASRRCRRSTEKSRPSRRRRSGREYASFPTIPASPPRCTTCTTSLPRARSSMNGGPCGGGRPLECGSLLPLFCPLKAVPGHRTPKALPWAQRPVNIVLSFSSSEASNGLALATLLTTAAVLVLGLAVVARARASLFCWIFCAAIALTGATTPLGVWRYSWGYYPRGSLSNLWLVAVFAGILAASIRLLWRASHDSEGQSRQGARAMMFAFIASSFAL